MLPVDAIRHAERERVLILVAQLGLMHRTDGCVRGHRLPSPSTGKGRARVHLEHVALGREDGRSIVRVERVVLVESEEEVLQRFGCDKRGLFVLQCARVEVEDGGETARDASAVVDIVQDLLGE